MNKLYQISYGKTEENMGWHSFNIEPGIPNKLISFFGTFSSACAPGNFDSESLKNEDGSYRDAIAIFSYGGIFGQTQVRYGFRESNSSREYMIATGFVSEIPKTSEWEPNEIVSVSKENFRFIPSESFEIVSELKRDPSRSYEEIVAKYNLSQKTVLDIFRVVNLAMFEERNNATYFVCDPDDEMIKDLIYLIYDLLPFELRHNVMFTNTNLFKSPVCKIFKFVENKPNMGGVYYNISTGETNAALDRTETYADRFPLLGLFKHGYETYKSGCAAFSEKVKAYEFNRTAMTYRNFLLIRDLGEGINALKEYSDDKLDMFVEKLLFSHLPNNAEINNYLYRALNLLYERKIVPSDEAIEAINEKAEMLNNEMFRNTALKLALLNKINGDEKEMFKYFDEKKDTDEYPRIITLLVSEKKDSIIVNYYRFKINRCGSLEELKALTENLYNLQIHKKVGDLLLEKLEELCYAGIRMHLHTENGAQRVLESVDRYCERFFSGESANIKFSIKNRYIEGFNTSGEFSFDRVCIENLRTLARGANVKSKKLSDIIDIYCAINDYANRTGGKNPIYRISSSIKDFFKDYSVGEKFARELFDYMLETIPDCQNGGVFTRNKIDEFIYIWLSVAYIIDRFVQEIDITSLLLKADLDAIMNDYTFEHELLMKLGLNGDVCTLELLYNSFSEYLRSEDSKSENYKLIKRRADMIKAQLPKKESKSKFSFFKKK